MTLDNCILSSGPGVTDDHRQETVDIFLWRLKLNHRRVQPIVV
jgi:hypothetical protein